MTAAPAAPARDWLSETGAAVESAHPIAIFMQTQPRLREADLGPDPRGMRAQTDPRLTANLRGDYEALQNDFEQAQMLAADFKGQLAGKTNEVAHLKQVFEKAALDLANLQEGINALREERHRLANEAMRAVALEHRLKRAEAENARLQAEVERLTQQPATTPVTAPAASAPRMGNAEAQALLATACEALERLRGLVQAKDGVPPPRSIPLGPVASTEFIDITFGA